MDLYLPPAATTVPVVIWLHGGGWFTGDRTLAPDLSVHFAERGLAMAAIEYRLSGQATFPAQLYDVRTAVRYLRRNAETLGIDPQAVGVWGASAGGHLAALTGLAGHLDRLDGEDDDGDASVQAVAESYGPVDLTGLEIAVGTALPGAGPTPEAGLLRGPAEQNLALARCRCRGVWPRHRRRPGR
ncbi:Lipase 2 [Gordonia bronchialis]|nr:alpha/beta hydrolase fold domain-containing protein [Gordonia bronchialis]UAK40601.1 alpha/beta hydrolase [Gordonia bronchialis]STQ66365.1 Lipase 2 [Gordonia bronchialis]